MTDSPRVLSVVSILIDVSVSVPSLPERGGDVVGTAARTEVGAGFNLVAAVARQGVGCCYGGVHGSGRNGDLIRHALTREGVVLGLPGRDRGDTGFCLAMVEPSLETTYVTMPGVEADLTEADLGRLAVGPEDVVVLSGYDLLYPGSGAALTAWITAGTPGRLVLDPGPLVTQIPADRIFAVLERLSILTLNRREAQQITDTRFTGEALLHQVCRELPLRDDALVVLREGADGCLAAGRGLSGGILHVPAVPVEAVDTAGAGDTHTGVLVARLLAGDDVATALAVANRAAAISVTRFGAATAPTAAELG